MKGNKSDLFSCVAVLLVLAVVEHTLEQNCFVRAQTYCEDKPKILFYRKGHAALVSGGSDDVGNHVVVSNVNKEFLACVSSRNVEWVYEGEGEPSKFQESSTVDIQKYEDGSISYCLTSQVTFYNKQSDTELSRHTGRYFCREIGNNSNAASVYVYSSRRNSPTFLHSRKTVTLPLSRGNLTTFIPGSRSTSSPNNNTSEKDNAVGIQSFTIPCITTRPNVSVRLLRKGKNNEFKVYSGTSHEFNPEYGFRVGASTPNLDDLSQFYGEFKCVSSPTARVAADASSGSSLHGSGTRDNGYAEDFVVFNLVRAKSFQAFPPVNEVYTSGMLNLTCEADEPVIMKEVLPSTAHDIYSYLDEDDYTRDRSDDLVETTERTDQSTHIANYMELAPAPGRTGEIQCLTEKDGKALHTWRYRIIRKRADKLSGIKFNKRENSFTCKSKLGSPGRLSFVSCRTPSECRVNRICLTKSENCRGYSNSTRAFCERKSHFCGKIFYKGGSGLIRCIGDGIDEIRGFTDESADQTVRMGFGKLKASETALLQILSVDKSENNGNLDPEQQLKKKEEKGNDDDGTVKEMSEGDRVNVTLRVGYYYFLYPVQWAVKFQNGSTSQLNPDSQSLKVEKLSRTVYATLTLPYTSATLLNGKAVRPGSTDKANPVLQPRVSEIVALNALIPLRSSVDPSWKTISFPITVYGKVGLSQLPSDGESDDMEQPGSTSNLEPVAVVGATNADSSSGTALSDIEAYEDDEDDAVEEEEQNEQAASSVDTSPNAYSASSHVKFITQESDNTREDIKHPHTGQSANGSEVEVATQLPASLEKDSLNHTASINNTGEGEIVEEEVKVEKVEDAILARSGLLEEDFNDDEVKEEVTQLPAGDDNESDVNGDPTQSYNFEEEAEVTTTTTNHS